MAAEVARVHQQWFSRYSELYHPRTRELVERGQDISDARLATALEERARFREALEEDTARAGVDLWLSPSAPGPAPKGIASTGDPVMNLPWTQAGLPTLSLPAGEVDADLPMGLQIAGRWATDETLLSWSEQLEKALDQM